MYVVIRSYVGEEAVETFDLIEQRIEEIKELIEEVPGFIRYTAIRSSDGGTAMTICEDKKGTDESTRIAARWVLENVAQTPPVPKVVEGEMIVQFPE